MIHRIIVAIACLISFVVSAQEQTGAVRGVVRDKQPIAEAAVMIKGTHIGTNTDAQGHFNLRVPVGKQVLIVQYLGKKTYEKTIVVKANESQTFNIELEDKVNELSGVEVRHISPVERINKLAYNAVAISAKELKKTNTNVADMLAKVSGIKIRETGGLGSAAQINLNGFTGKHIRIFVDGVQFNHENSAYQISNIPTDIVEWIEVYKGVVPIEFGEDALGGAINIVTKRTTHKYGYLSYTYGSFNTHKSSLGIAEKITPNIALELQAYQNYSDNNYKVKTKHVDLTTGLFSKDEKWFKRFHDRYHNEAIIGRVHFFDEKWADKLSISLHYTQMDAQVQNANLMKIAFGDKSFNSHTYSSQLEYEKINLLKNFNVYLNAHYDISKTQNIDDSYRRYTWDGSYIIDKSKGELHYTRTIFDARVANVTSKFEYLIGDKHNITLTNAFNEFKRDASDDLGLLSNLTDADKIGRGQLKNVTGLSYKYSPNERFDVILFGKHYYTKVKGAMAYETNLGWHAYRAGTIDLNAEGYGVATSYQVTQPLQLMASYERTYRLPTSRELFGDGNLEDGTIDLKPEHSDNINFNISYNPNFGNGHSVLIEPGLTYRNVNDYIIRVISDNGTGQSKNHGKTLGLGIDLSARYFYKERLSIGGNISYMDMRNKERYRPDGAESITYDDRVPNTPYLFGIVDGYYAFKNVFRNEDDLSLYYAFNYTKDYYWTWKSEGAKLNIPEQLSHDFSIIYTPAKKKYSVAFETRNFTDALLYDDYSLQKPGRSFYVKLRYNIF